MGKSDAGQAGRARQRGDPIGAMFAAVQESVVGTFRKLRDVRYLTALAGKADMRQPRRVQARRTTT